MQGDEMQDNKLQLTEFISVSELANLMDVSYAEVIGKCMGPGFDGVYQPASRCGSY